MYDEYHDEKMNKKEPIDETWHYNVIPLSMVRIEHLYDLYEKFKRVANCKMNNSTMK